MHYAKAYTWNPKNFSNDDESGLKYAKGKVNA